MPPWDKAGRGLTPHATALPAAAGSAAMVIGAPGLAVSPIVQHTVGRQQDQIERAGRRIIEDLCASARPPAAVARQGGRQSGRYRAKAVWGSTPWSWITGYRRRS